MAVAAGRRTILQVYVPHYTSLSIASINASSIDVIAYAFATVTSGGLCALSNAENAANLAALLQLKKRFPRLRTTLSVGGGDVATPFKTAAATNASRATFAQSCAALAARYSFDGLDVDWEVPVQSDATTYPLLMAALRAALPPGSLLTTASSTQNALQFQMAAAIAPVVDWINIMWADRMPTRAGYDYTGSWEAKPITKHNAPLFPSGAQPNAVGTAVLSYLAAGVPAGQLVLGVPFYGFQRTGVASSTAPTLAGAQGLFVSAAASPSYYLAAPDIQDLLAGDSNWAPYWDATACAAYAFNPVQASFITYESARSLATKAQYVGAHGLLGMMAWELSQDDSSSTLLNAMAAGLRADETPDDEAPEDQLPASSFPDQEIKSNDREGSEWARSQAGNVVAKVYASHDSTIPADDKPSCTNSVQSKVDARLNDQIRHTVVVVLGGETAPNAPPPNAVAQCVNAAATRHEPSRARHGAIVVPMDVVGRVDVHSPGSVRQRILKRQQTAHTRGWLSEPSI
nr:GH18 chitinase [Plasmodiophora brassicae]